QIKSEMQQPSSLVNDVVNRVFYPPGHGYFLSFTESLAQIKQVKRPAIVKLHGEIINAALHQITAVGSLPPAELKSKLDQHFGALSAKNVAKKAAQPPVFSLKETFALEDKKIPTAYINIKTN